MVYEFKCVICDTIIEQGSTVTMETHCGKPMRRIYGVTGIHYKGSGFYANDKKRQYK